MFVIYDKEKQLVPIKIWGKGPEEVEDNVLEQLQSVSNHPAVFKHVSAMPDYHYGYGICIGGVVALMNAVVPFFVGVDIGCGVSAIKTSIKKLSVEQIKQILGKIRPRIPVGEGHAHKDQQEWKRFGEFLCENYPRLVIAGKDSTWYTPDSWTLHERNLGTLGGGK